MSRLSGKTATVTWNPGSIADDEELELDVTVPGARLGDMSFVSIAFDTLDLIISSNVTADDTVTIVLANVGGTARDIGAATVRVLVVPKDAFFN